jgi:hypothetical protein
VSGPEPPMNCREVQDWLLESEDARPESCDSPEMAAHLEQCAACRRLAAQLVELEVVWRDLPAPAAAEGAKADFLARLPELAASGSMSGAAGVSPVSRGAVTRRRWLQRSAAAAAGLLAVGGGAWLLFSGREAEADDDLMDRLVDWNLQLAEAASPDERERLYSEAEPLQAAIAAAKLPPEHAALAESFLDNGTWLVSHQDPVFAADRFDGLAGRLLDLARAAGEKGNHKRMKRLLEQYNRVLETGVNPNIESAEASGTLDFEHQKRLEKLTIEDSRRLRQLTSLLDRAPDASRAEIRRALGQEVKRAKNKKTGKGKKSPPANGAASQNAVSFRNPGTLRASGA